MPFDAPDRNDPRPLRWPVQVVNLPPKGLSGKREADEAERRAVAAFLELLALRRLELTYSLMPHGAGRIHMKGWVEAEVEQACVITGDPVSSLIDEAVDLEFWPEADLEEVEEEASASFGLEDEEPPEPILGGRIDLGAIAVEFLSLGLDPYPRRPGAEFVTKEGRAEADSPFAALSRLKEATPKG